MNKRDYLLSQLAKGWSPLDVRDAILEAPLQGTVKMVLTAIVSHRAANGKASVGVRRLAQLAGVNKDTAASCVRKLVALQLVQRTEGGRKDDPPIYDLDGLPSRLIQLLSVSETEGHQVSESSGHDVSESKGQETETPCPNPVDRGVRNEPPAVSEKGGPAVSETKGQKQEELKQEEISRKSRRTRARATTPKRAPALFFLPDGWKPTDEHLAYATENSVDVVALVAKYKADVSGGRRPSKNAATVSFDGIFWTYLRNDVKWTKERAANGNGPRKAAPPQRGRDEHVETEDWTETNEPPKTNVRSIAGGTR